MQRAGGPACKLGEVAARSTPLHGYLARQSLHIKLETLYGERMNVRRKGIAKLLGGTTLTLVLPYSLLVLFPQPLFAHKVEYRSFEIYSHDSIDDRIYRILDEVSRRLDRSMLLRPAGVQRVFFCKSAEEFTFFAPHRRRSTSINYQLGHNIFIRGADCRANHVGDPGRYGSTLTWIITHEAVHTLEQESIGLQAALALPFWKREGYAEYVAQETELSLRDGIHRLEQDLSPVIILGDKIAIPRAYFEARLLVEYYFATREPSFERLVSDQIDPTVLRQEMITWVQP